MKLFIPACGDQIRLTSIWEFDLYLESRNNKFAETLDLFDPDEKANKWGRYGSVHEGDYRSPLKRVRATLCSGTVLECDRVYIRTFNRGRIQLDNDYDSVTWKVMKNGKPVRNSRFWVKLPDCYNIQFELDADSLYRDRVKLVKSVLGS